MDSRCPSRPDPSTWRRRGAALGLVGALGGALAAGCAAEGLDGDLTDDWGSLSAPRAFVPDAPVCHAAPFAATTPATDYETVDCGATHGTETVHVGTFSGAEAATGTPPVAGSPALRAAYGECERAANGFLGDDWRSGPLWLGVTLPTARAWAGGARWYRCDLIQTAGKDDDTPVARTATLRDVLRGARPLAYGCYQVTSDNVRVTTMKKAACTASHNAEFVGVYVAPDTAYRKPDAARWASYHGACRGMIAKYVGISTVAAKAVGTLVSPQDEAEWRRGNRGVLCHLWLETKQTTTSLRGAGALPS